MERCPGKAPEEFQKSSAKSPAVRRAMISPRRRAACLAESGVDDANMLSNTNRLLNTTML